MSKVKRPPVAAMTSADRLNVNTHASASPELQAEEVARLQKKAVVRPSQAAELKAARFRQEAAVPGEKHRAGRRLIREQRVHAEPVPLARERRRVQPGLRIADHD